MNDEQAALTAVRLRQCKDEIEAEQKKARRAIRKDIKQRRELLQAANKELSRECQRRLEASDQAVISRFETETTVAFNNDRLAIAIATTDSHT